MPRGARTLQPELMDDPALRREPHLRALRGLARINAVSGAAGALFKPLEAIARRSGPLSVLDVACGSGDVTAQLARLSERHGLEILFTACDISPVALEQVRRRSTRIQTIQRDVTRQGLPGDCDVVISSLFMHHLDESRIVDLLAAMRGSARRAILISDLCRSRRGLLLAAGVPRLVTRSGIVHTDAVRSARAALTAEEIAGLAGRAGLDGARVTRHFPSRWLLEWCKDPPA